MGKLSRSRDTQPQMRSSSPREMFPLLRRPRYESMTIILQGSYFMSQASLPFARSLVPLRASQLTADDDNFACPLPINSTLSVCPSLMALMIHDGNTGCGEIPGPIIFARLANLNLFAELVLHLRCKLWGSALSPFPFLLCPFTFQRHWHSALLAHSFLFFSLPRARPPCSAVHRWRKRRGGKALCSTYSPSRTNA